MEIPGIGEKMVEKIHQSVAAYFQSLDAQQAAEAAEAAANRTWPKLTVAPDEDACGRLEPARKSKLHREDDACRRRRAGRGEAVAPPRTAAESAETKRNQIAGVGRNATRHRAICSEQALAGGTRAERRGMTPSQ